MLAAKTYMYLPLFLAKEKGIFKSVFEAKRIKDDIEFRICDGDDDAIDSMLDFNRNARKLLFQTRLLYCGNIKVLITKQI